MFATRVDLQLGQHCPAELVLWHHALHGFLNNHFRRLVDQFVERDRFDTARIARVMVIHLVSRLVAGNNYLFCINNNDIVTCVHMWREFWLVLAAQSVGDLGTQATERLVGSIHDVPAVLHFFFLDTNSLHDQILSYVSLYYPIAARLETAGKSPLSTGR